MTKTATERQALRNDHPDSWVPVNPGDLIEGKIVDVVDAWSDQRRDPVTGKQGAPYPLLTLLVNGATGYEDRLPCELKVHGFGAVLYNEIMRKQPNIGEAIGIVYQGPGTAKPGQSAPELYRVRGAAGTDSAKRAYAAIGSRNVAATVPAGPAEPVQTQIEQDEDIPF